MQISADIQWGHRENEIDHVSAMFISEHELMQMWDAQ